MDQMAPAVEKHTAVNKGKGVSRKTRKIGQETGSSRGSYTLNPGTCKSLHLAALEAAKNKEIEPRPKIARS